MECICVGVAIAKWIEIIICGDMGPVLVTMVRTWYIAVKVSGAQIHNKSDTTMALRLCL